MLVQSGCGWGFCTSYSVYCLTQVEEQAEVAWSTGSASHSSEGQASVTGGQAEERSWGRE